VIGQVVIREVVISEVVRARPEHPADGVAAMILMRRSVGMGHVTIDQGCRRLAAPPETAQ
jgi:hypothetical protein